LLWKNAKEISLDEVLCSIKEDLKNFNVIHDNWYYESSLGSLNESSSPISNAMNFLKDSGQAYIENGALWLDTSSAKDDKNRVLVREDGRPTYFASDVAYHKDKIDRGFDTLINVWGADHHGYIKRIESSIEGLGFDKNKLNVQLVQFANLFKDGKKVKMSTRSGEFYTLSDLVDEIGRDAARFYYLSKQADQHLDFDIDLAKADNKENIFYYIQYAHARICSLQEKFLENNKKLPGSANEIENNNYKNCDELIHEISKFPDVVKRSGANLHPHLVVYYLKDFSQCFHSFYNDNHVLSESLENMDSILFCLNAAKQVIANGLNLLGIEPIEKM
jgi:arginyl-tRNA synthetase